ncbi:hypothetical protein [Membranihabitans maritimus]|nr:hypothetical protein [Membranihabitans maritimus]
MDSWKSREAEDGVVIAISSVGVQNEVTSLEPLAASFSWFMP